MKWITASLALLAALLVGSWAQVARQNAAMLQARLGAPFQEEAQKHAQNLKYGQMCPDFVLKNQTGQSYRLGGVCARSRLTIVTGIRPAQADSIDQLIDLREAYTSLHAKGLSVLALTAASAPVIADLKRRYVVPFPILLDPGERTLAKLGATEEPYGLLLTPMRQAVFVASGPKRRLDVNEIADKATLTLTGLRMPAVGDAAPNTWVRLSDARPLILNDLEGNPARLPLPVSTVLVVFSTECPSCQAAYQELGRVWKASGQSHDLAVVFAGPGCERAPEWLTAERRRILPNARFLMDPTNLARRRLQMGAYGSAAFLAADGSVIDRADYKGQRGYERDLSRLFGGEEMRR